MKTITTGTLSGCFVWFLVAFVIGSCLLPIAWVIGTTTTETDLAVRATAPFVCPGATTPHLHSFDTTIPDDNGVDMPATGYELQCLDSSGNIVKTDPIVWGFIWLGLSVGVALILTALLGLVFAAPAGVLVGRFFGKMKVTRA